MIPFSKFFILGTLNFNQVKILWIMIKGSELGFCYYHYSNLFVIMYSLHPQ